MQPPHILLVDDEERFVQNLARLLEARGFIVSTAFNGSQALDILAADSRIRLVVLDVRMPGMDGLETLQQIKARDPETAVIMLTGHASMQDGIEAVRQGALDYLQKPCDIEDLKAKIATAWGVERIRRHPILWPRTRAGEIILSGFIPLTPEDTLEKALTIFRRCRDGEGTRALYVVDTQWQVCGKLGKRDLIRAAESEHPGDPPTWQWVLTHPESLRPVSVEQVMEREVRTVSPDTSLREAAQQMLDNQIDAVPVTTDAGTLLGVIRLRDALLYLHAAEELENGDFSAPAPGVP